MLCFARPPISLIVFLGALVGVGTAFGHPIDSAGVAAFLLLVASIEGKPAWKYWFDPAKRESGRATMARGATPAPRAVPKKPPSLPAATEDAGGVVRRARTRSVLPGGSAGTAARGW